VSKLLTLTGFTLSEGDSLTINISPNTANTATIWFLGCGCETDVDCSTCLDEYISSPYPILSGTVSTTLEDCDSVVIDFDVSGCTENQINNMDITKYFGNFDPADIRNISTNNATQRLTRISLSLYFSNTECFAQVSFSNTCAPSNSNTITYIKEIVGGIGRITITCSDYSDFLSFYNGYLTNYNNHAGTPSDPTNIDYYRYLYLTIPSPATTACGDGTNFDYYYIHYSTTVTTGGTGPWTVQLTMPTISRQISFDGCDINCLTYVNGVVISVNNSSTGTTNNINTTSNTGNRVIQPISRGYWVYEAVNTRTTSSWSGYYTVAKWQNQTIGWTGETNTYVPQFSGEACTFNTWNNSLPTIYRKDLYNYIVGLTNPSNPADFDISGATIVNSAYSGYPSSVVYQLALRYSGGVITYADPYFVK
jgi:hypothetical protein